MIRIAFVAQSLGIGGSEKSLVNLINILPIDDFDITIYYFENDLRIVPQIKRKVNLHLLKVEDNLKQQIIHNIKNRKILFGLKIFFNALVARFCNQEKIEYKKAVVRMLPSIGEEYDVAIYYSLPTRIGLLYTIMNLKAKKYLAWVHMDISVYEKERIIPMKRIYAKYDRIICVSDYSKTAFISVFPSLSKKVQVMRNIMNYSEMERLANYHPHTTIDKSKIIIFTCSRLSHEKRPNWAISVFEEILEQYSNVVWIWAGDGELMNSLQELIHKKNLEDSFFLLGAIDNPYPYYRICDLYVQLSEHESYCLTLDEAVYFGCNIICTDFPTAYEITKESDSCIIIKNEIELKQALVSQLNMPKTSQKHKKKKSSLENGVSVFKSIIEC